MANRTIRQPFVTALVLIALAALGFVAVRFNPIDGSKNPAESISSETVGEGPAGQLFDPAQSDEPNPLQRHYPLVDFPPPPSQEQLIAGSQLIVLGTLTAALGQDRILPTGAEDFIAAPGEPERGVLVSQYQLQVDEYIKGSTPAKGDIVTLEVLADITPELTLGVQQLIFLVPYREGTYQAGALTVLQEDSGKVVSALGEEVGSAMGETLVDYAAAVGAIVRRQAIEGPPGDLAVPLIRPGERITPAHFLGLQTTKRIRVLADTTVVDLEPGEVSTIVSLVSQPMLIEAMKPFDPSDAVVIEVALDDGHVWHFSYLPYSGALIYAPASLQVSLPDSARDIIGRALGDS